MDRKNKPVTSLLLHTIPFRVEQQIIEIINTQKFFVFHLNISLFFTQKLYEKRFVEFSRDNLMAIAAVFAYCRPLIVCFGKHEIGFLA